MRTALRVLAVVVVVPFTLMLMYLPLSMVSLGSFSWLEYPIALGCAIAAGWFTWKMFDAERKGLATSVALGALVAGGIAFAVGFFGPLIWAPEANQGPLLGIFITGPLGFAFGAIGGLVYWVVKQKNISPQSHKPAYRQAGARKEE